MGDRMETTGLCNKQNKLEGEVFRSTSQNLPQQQQQQQQNKTHNAMNGTMKSRCFYYRDIRAIASLWIVVSVVVLSSSRNDSNANAWMLAGRTIRHHSNILSRSQMSEDRQVLSTALRRPSVLSSRLMKSLQRNNLISCRSSQVVSTDVDSSSTMTTNQPIFLTNGFAYSQTSSLKMDKEENDEDGEVVNILGEDSQNLGQDNEKLRLLYHSLPTSSTEIADEKSPIIFDTSEEDVVRGIYITRPFKKDEPILRIPLDPTTTTEDSSWFGCLVDNRPPSWLPEHVQDAPDKWATRLAASWLDLFLQHQQKNDSTSGSFELWLDLLPEPEELRSSLPVHWSEDTLRMAKCTTLELAVDSAFFVRGEAMADLMEGLQDSPYKIADGSQNVLHSSTWEKLCEYALDLVQTRACRLELKHAGSHTVEDGPSEQYTESNQIRVMAPIFDFINHGGSRSANAYFELEELHKSEHNDVEDDNTETLVVKASRDVEIGEQLLIDYGVASTWPSWKCLFSYGFVPQYDPLSENDEAEVYVAGVRYEVSRDTIPVEMVMTACPMPESEEGGVELSSELANKLANRITVAAYNLLLETDDDFDEDVDEDLSRLFSEQLAANLRWSQHRVLLACADGLIKYVEEMQNHVQE